MTAQGFEELFSVLTKEKKKLYRTKKTEEEDNFTNDLERVFKISPKSWQPLHVLSTRYLLLSYSIIQTHMELLPVDPSAVEGSWIWFLNMAEYVKRHQSNYIIPLCQLLPDLSPW